MKRNIPRILDFRALVDVATPEKDDEQYVFLFLVELLNDWNESDPGVEKLTEIYGRFADIHRSWLRELPEFFEIARNEQVRELIRRLRELAKMRLGYRVELLPVIIRQMRLVRDKLNCTLTFRELMLNCFLQCDMAIFVATVWFKRMVIAYPRFMDELSDAVMEDSVAFVDGLFEIIGIFDENFVDVAARTCGEIPAFEP
jgi:hypothetical protein